MSDVELPKNDARPEKSLDLARRAGLIATGTLMSRLLGWLRDAVITATFAVSLTDAFWLAFTIPNALRLLLGEGAVSAAFVPVLTDVQERRGFSASGLVFARLAGAMLVLLVLVALMGSLLAPWLVRLYASGFERDPELLARTVRLARIVFPYVALVGTASLVMGALHAVKRFAAPAFAPAMLNIALIGGALWVWFGGKRDSAVALAYAALIGGALHILVQLPSLRRAGYPLRPRFVRGDPDVARVFRLLAPLLVALGVYQLNIVASRQFASYLPTGAITYLFLGQRLVEIPQGVFALAIGSAALPNLATHSARGELDKAKSLFRESLCLSFFVALPSAVGIGLLAEPFVGVLYGRGAFGPADVVATAWSLRYLAAGIWAVASVRIVVPMFHSLGDTRSPIIASAVNLVVFFSVSLLSMNTLRHAGLALAITGAATAQLIVLLLLLHHRIGPVGMREIGVRVSLVALASAAMGAVLWSIGADDYDSAASFSARVAYLLLHVVVAVVVYGSVAWIVRAPELRSVTATLRRWLRPGKYR